MTETPATGHRVLAAALGAPARYFPPAKGHYQVAPGLYRLGHDLGNGAQDGRILQLDRQWPHYRAEKLRARAERLDKYVAVAGLRPRTRQAAAFRLLQRMLKEYPALFRLEDLPGDEGRLHCLLSGETLHLDQDLNLLGVEGGAAAPAYADTLDALACQIQEDLAITELDGRGDRLAYVHLCFPNHWAAQDKIGRDFLAVHAPVPHFDRIAAQSRRLLESLARKGPFERFAWGLVTDTRLNHHPEPPADWPDPALWQGRAFDARHPRLYLRVERQTLSPLPQARAFLFTIRTYFEDVAALHPARREALRRALASMSARTLAYKGLTRSRAGILAWLQAGTGPA